MRPRQKRTTGFSGAELLWLTGDAQGQHANKFALIGLEHPTRPADFERIEDILSRAAGVVSDERIAEIRADLEGMRTKPAA